MQTNPTSITLQLSRPPTKPPPHDRTLRKRIKLLDYAEQISPLLALTHSEDNPPVKRKKTSAIPPAKKMHTSEASAQHPSGIKLQLMHTSNGNVMYSSF